MPDFFDDRGFNEFYLKSAKSKDKERLLRAFMMHGLTTGDRTTQFVPRQKAG